MLHHGQKHPICVHSGFSNINTCWFSTATEAAQREALIIEFKAIAALLEEEEADDDDLFGSHMEAVHTSAATDVAAHGW